MSAKITPFVHPSDVYTEDVLKCVRETIRSKGEFINTQYKATKTAARDDQTFLTCIEDQNKAWRTKFDRRQLNLTHGFFADKTKPYETVGTVYLESGDLVLESITDDLKSKITKRPYYSKEAEKQLPRKPPSQQRKLHSLTPTVSHQADSTQATAGYSAIKCRISEVNEMKKGVFAQQTLGGYLFRKESDEDVKEAEVKKEDPLKMHAPEGRNWTIVRSLGQILQKQKVIEKEPASPTPALTRLLKKTKKGGGKFFSLANKLQKPLLGKDLGDLQEREVLLIRWRKQLRLDYLKSKLHAINSVFCALFNMKAKWLKLNHPLSHKAVKDLLRSEISLDEYGKPSSWKPPQQPVSAVDDGGFQQDCPPDANTEASKVGSAATSSQIRKRNSSTYIPTTNSSRVNKPKANPHLLKAPKPSYDTYGPKIETWEDLLIAGERGNRNSVGSSNRYKIRRRDTATQINITETNPPWNYVSQAERMLIEKRRVNVMGSTTKRTAEDVLEDMRTDFSKLQKKLSKDMEDECNRQRLEQYKLIKCKFQTITLGPIPSLSLDKMRIEARMKTRDRKDSSAKPLKWYVELKTEISSETDGLRNDKIKEELENVSRFQYEDGQTITLAKEKLCLLVMSIPAHIILTVGMTDGISFILDKILGAPAELLQYWLAGRKLDKISTMLRYQHRPKSVPT